LQLVKQNVVLVAQRLAQPTRPIMSLLQQRDPLHGQHLRDAKVLLPIGLWVAAVAVAVRLTMQVLAVEVVAMLSQALTR
jgi:hypothetical protein